MFSTSEFKHEIPILEFSSWIYLVFAFCKASLAFIPEFSARIKGIYSSAAANPLTAYYYTLDISSACFHRKIELDSSAAPPPTIT